MTDFDERLKSLEEIINRLTEISEEAKVLKKRKTALDNWIKEYLEKTSRDAGVETVQAVYGNSTYTLTRNKTYKNRAPTQKQIREKLESFFYNGSNPKEFLTLTPKQKADAVFKYIWDNRGTFEKTCMTRRVSKK